MMGFGILRRCVQLNGTIGAGDELTDYCTCFARTIQRRQSVHRNPRRILRLTPNRTLIPKRILTPSVRVILLELADSCRHSGTKFVPKILPSPATSLVQLTVCVYSD